MASFCRHRRALFVRSVPSSPRHVGRVVQLRRHSQLEQGMGWRLPPTAPLEQLELVQAPALAVIALQDGEEAPPVEHMGWVVVVEQETAKNKNFLN